jgi:hypothetical protein
VTCLLGFRTHCQLFGLSRTNRIVHTNVIGTTGLATVVYLAICKVPIGSVRDAHPLLCAGCELDGLTVDNGNEMRHLIAMVSSIVNLDRDGDDQLVVVVVVAATVIARLVPGALSRRESQGTS